VENKNGQSICGKNLFNVLSQMYPDARCELHYQTPFELLVAVILSAQCTDKRVNLVTKELFKAANTAEKMVELDIEEIERLIYSCGFYKNKAASLKSMAMDIMGKFKGEVPDNLEDLMGLRGVGRKTANVVLAEVFNKEAIAVDTHVFRVSRRLGLSDGNTPLLVEKDLIKVFGDAGLLSKMHHLLIFHGRYCCHSQRPNCVSCKLKEYCKICL